MPEELQGRLTGAGTPGIYNPYFERNMAYLHGIRPMRDIKKDEELLTNYMSFASSIDFWEEGLYNLRTQCGGSAGGIEDYQQYKLKRQQQ